MATLDYLRHEKLSQLNRQFLTSLDWDFWIDFSHYSFQHPSMELIKAQTKNIGDIDATLKNNLLEQSIRNGITIIQPGDGSDNAKPKEVSFNMVDFEDQTLKYWFLDYTNKMDSLTTRVGYHRNDLMLDIYVWRLNSALQKVWQYHYFNCLPTNTSYSDKFEADGRTIVGGDISITFKAERMIPTPFTSPMLTPVGN